MSICEVVGIVKVIVCEFLIVGILMGESVLTRVLDGSSGVGGATVGVLLEGDVVVDVLLEVDGVVPGVSRGDVPGLIDESVTELEVLVVVMEVVVEEIGDPVTVPLLVLKASHVSE